MKEKIERGISLLKLSYEEQNPIMKDYLRAEALLYAQQIAQEKYPNCNPDRVYSVYFIFCAAAEMGKTEINSFLKEHDIISE